MSRAGRVVGTLVDVVWKVDKRDVGLTVRDLTQPVGTDGSSTADGIENPVENEG